MIKKLTKHGNSTALIIDKSILRLLKIDNNTELTISTNGTSIIITPIKKDLKFKVSENEAIQKAFEEVMKQYEPALKKLAKS